MKTDSFLRKAVASIIALCVNFIAAIIFMQHLPEQIPVHFNADLVCDRTGSRNFLIFIFAIMPLVFGTVLFIASRNEKIRKNARLYTVWITVCTVLDVLFTWLILFMVENSYKTGVLDMSAMWLVPAVSGAAFTVIGNYLPTLRQNNIIGYRISWTLENEQCWKLTHQFAGKTAYITGILMIITALILKAAEVPGIVYSTVTMVFLTIIIALPMVYSYNHRNDK